MKTTQENCGRRCLRFLTALLFCLWVHSSFAQTNPVRIASNEPSSAFPEGVSICLSGKYAFLGTGSTATNVIWVYEISNLTNPVPVGNVGTIQPATHLKILGESIFAFEQRGWPSTFEIFNVSNPTNPVKIAEIPVGYHGNNTRFAVFDKYIYLPVCPQDPDTCSTGIWDVSNPTNPISVGPTDFRAGAILDTSGKLLYSAGGRESGLAIYDLSNPTNPVVIGRSEEIFFSSEIKDLKVRGNYAYLTIYTNFMAIFDVSNPTNPATVWNPYGFGHAFTGLLDVSGNYEYITGLNLTILDLSDLTAPTIAAQTAPSEYDFNDIVIAGEYALCAKSYPTLGIYWLGASSAPLLSLETRNNNQLALSWPAPNSAFALQQSPNLAAATWQTMTNAPFTTNHRNQVILPNSSDKMFYRLISQ